VATTPAKTEPENPAPFVSVAIANLPTKQSNRGRPFDWVSANALYDLANAGRAPKFEDANGPSDNKTYNTLKDARNASGKARRLLERALKEKESAAVEAKTVSIKTRVWGENGEKNDAAPFRWVVAIVDVPAES
jgi:hypothetical protein